jgi:CDP-glycerol glycerophosphotransferase
VDKTLVLLESHHAADFIGNPYYIAQHVLAKPQFSNLKVIIVCPRKARKRVRQAFGNSGFRFCTNRSISYAYYLATAGFLVNDVTFPIYFSRRTEQKYLNTWHGTPLKSLGRKCRNDLFLFISNTQRNFLHATHLLAPNLHTENILVQDYMIEKFWNGTVIRCGYPRNDILVNNTKNPENSDKSKLQVVFMPTWRGGLSTVDEASQVQIKELKDLLDIIDTSLDNTIVFWVRLHPLVKGQVELTKYAHIRPFPANLEPYKHLASCDALVTDYSSVLFDFACTGKPIILYTPDLNQYQEERDFCIDPETLPFDRVTTVEQLLNRMKGLRENSYQVIDTYQHFQREYCNYDRGNSTHSVCNSFFLKESSVEVRNVHPDPSRLKVLLFGGSFLNNGITTSLKTLLSKLDLDRVDVMLWVSATTAQKNAGDWFHTADSRVSYIPTRNWLSVDPIDAIRMAIKDVFSSSWALHDFHSREVWSREWCRHFGGAQFDTIVHFTGYERFVYLLMMNNSLHKVAFAHNDLAAEVSSGKFSDPRALHLGIELADVLAVVREGVEDQYFKNYSQKSQKIIFVPNTLKTNCRKLSEEPLTNALDSRNEPLELERTVNAFANPDVFRFINLARFSPEKGQKRLIAAFERVWKSEPNTQLFIVGGYGKEFENIKNVAESSPASSAIFVLLGSSNPFPLASKMNSMILSSFYEGRPMVLYEAFELGLDVISTDIPGPSEVLNQGYGLVVENSEDGLVEGMKAAIRGEVPHKTFDFEAHNKFAVEQFMKAITPEGFPVANAERLVN